MTGTGSPWDEGAAPASGAQSAPPSPTAAPLERTAERSGTAPAAFGEPLAVPDDPPPPPNDPPAVAVSVGAVAGGESPVLAGAPGRIAGSGVPGGGGVSADKVMPLVDHLAELRSRLIKSALAVAAGSVIGFLVAGQVIDFLVSPLPTHQVQVLGPGDAFVIYLKVALVVGVILAMPVILYQLWAFVAPGLTPKERQVVRPWIPLALAFFALGVAIAYVILPFATGFLLSFTGPHLVANIAAGPYFDFVTTLFLAFGLLMEYPILLVGLSRVGLVTSARLRGSRRYAILAIAIFAAAATPGGDLVSPTVLGVALYVLYELTTFYIARTGR